MHGAVQLGGQHVGSHFDGLIPKDARVPRARKKHSVSLNSRYFLLYVLGGLIIPGAFLFLFLSFFLLQLTTCLSLLLFSIQSLLSQCFVLNKLITASDSVLAEATLTYSFSYATFSIYGLSLSWPREEGGGVF